MLLPCEVVVHFLAIANVSLGGCFRRYTVRDSACFNDSERYTDWKSFSGRYLIADDELPSDLFIIDTWDLWNWMEPMRSSSQLITGMILGLFLCLIVGTNNVEAQQLTATSPEVEQTLTPIEQRLASLENEVEYLRRTQDEPNNVSIDAACNTQSTCGPNRRFEFGAEAVFLSPHSTTGLGPAGIAAFPSVGYFESWRGWIGFSNENGVGLRGRFWEFDQLVDNNQNAFTYGLDTYIADLEATMSRRFGNWDVQLSGGIRYVDFHEDRTFVSSSFVDSELIGVVLGGEVKRPLANGVRGFGVVRMASVYGDLTGEVPNGFVVVLDNVHSMMWEAQLGMEFSRQTRLGDVSLRSGVEIQHWDDITYKQISGTTSTNESIGLLGFFAGFNFSR